MTPDERDKKTGGSPDHVLRGLATRLWALPIEEYLASEDFSRFCRELELDDAWKEYLELSRDRPDLYGSAVTKGAFVLFLHHILHSRPEEFPALFARLLMDFSRGISCALPLDGLEADLVRMGYSEKEVEDEFSRVRAYRKDAPRPRDDTCCPD